MQSKKNTTTACYTNLDLQNGWCATYDMDNLTMDNSLNNNNEKVSVNAKRRCIIKTHW